MTERRTARRYNLSLPITFRVRREKDGSVRNGMTRDVSTQGVYFTIEDLLNAGTAVDIVLVLPYEIAHGPAVLVRATGRVVRVDNGSSRDCAAAIIENYAFVRDETREICTR